jgi:predicted transcriptional regulator of viral defense system
MCKHILMERKLSKNTISSIKARLRGPLSDSAFEAEIRDICQDYKIADPNRFVRKILKEGIVYEYLVKGFRGDKKYYYSTRTDISPYEVTHLLWSRAYYCNLTAVFYHNLTNQVPSVIYIAKEGKGRKRDAPKVKKKIKLSNESIFQAFIKPGRVTSNEYKLPGGKIVLTERTYRDEIGVIELLDKHELLPMGSRVTCLERTLIDACVNPQYNGGILSVVDYFREAKGRIDSDRLIEIYKHLSFVYPYWQAIGFICEKVGAKKAAKALYGSFKAANEFYLDHNAKTSWAYDDKWRVHYPEVF